MEDTCHILPSGSRFLTSLCGAHPPCGVLPRWTPGLFITFCPLWSQGRVTGGHVRLGELHREKCLLL